MRDRLISLLVWLGIFLSGGGIASIIVATRVHGEYIKPFATNPGDDPLPVCWAIQDSFDVSAALIKGGNVWKEKMSEGKCAIVTLPWFYNRTMIRNDGLYIGEVLVKQGEWHTMYAVFVSLPRTVEA